MIAALALAPAAAFTPSAHSSVHATRSPRCQPPVALFDQLGELTSSIAGAVEALSSSLVAAENALPAKDLEGLASFATSAEAMVSYDLEGLASLATSAEAMASSRASDAITQLATVLGSDATKIPAEVQSELVPLLEAKQAELLQQLDLVEALIEKTTPPRFPYDLGDLAARDEDLSKV